MEELPHLMQTMHMEETPTPNMQEAMGMYQVTHLQHLLLVMEAAHINTLHLAEVSLMMMNSMVITGDNNH
jgi:hypothetical protein